LEELIIEKIDNFGGEYRWLSNFYNHRISYQGVVYLSTEAAYQASKSLDEGVRLQFSDLNPRESKELGQTIEKRADWETYKENVMYDVLELKFKDRVLRKRLIETGDAELIEGNWWHDNIWGNCSCVNCINIEGRNMLGKTLMLIRDQINAGML